jgi:hypothetical protein
MPTPNEPIGKIEVPLSKVTESYAAGGGADPADTMTADDSENSVVFTMKPDHIVHNEEGFEMRMFMLVNAMSAS